MSPRLPLLFLVLLAGCDANFDIHDNDVNVGTGGHSADGPGSPGAPLPPPPPGSPAAAVAAACAAPHGPTIGAPRTAAAFARALSRRWFICGFDPSSVSDLVSHAGIEFTSEGHWHFLGQDAQGNYAPSVGADMDGGYEIYSSARDGLVPPTDTAPSDSVGLHWEHGGPLDLDLAFEASPLRFKTWNGIDLWFVSLDDSDASTLTGAEGMSCNPQGISCADGLTCDSDDARHDGTCFAPAVVGRGEGCDDSVRRCAPGFACLSSARCGTIGHLGDSCGGDLARCADAEGLHCDRGQGICSGPADTGAWCDDDSHCAVPLLCDYEANRCAPTR